MLYEKLYEKITQELTAYYKKEDKGQERSFRNAFHIEMPFGLINDPNGLSYYNNQFHIFFQWNPFGCEHKTKHWGLVTTKDFANYTIPKIVLKPEEWYDKDGCYSGGAFVKDGMLRLFYTGNVKGSKNERSSYQCLVQYKNEGLFEKKGVIIKGQPDGYTAHFRDPMVFEENGNYYMVLGIQTQAENGKAVLYQSSDLEQWNFIGELKTNLSDFGYMWECPNLFKVDVDKYAFLFSPQGLREEEFNYQNLYQSGYIIGALDINNTSLQQHTNFREIDKGFDFYAPQVFSHQGQSIMMAWVGMPEKDEEYPTTKEGYVFSLTMPRVLTYQDGRLYQEPFAFLEDLRQSKVVERKEEAVKAFSLTFEERAVEYLLDANIANTDSIQLNLKFGEEHIVIFYDKQKELCVVDRTNMKLGGKGIRKFKLKAEDSFQIHLFVDQTVIELFYQNGQETTTIAYFPEYDGVTIELENTVFINRLEVWELKKIKYQ